jgi:hypothetical protein
MSGDDNPLHGLLFGPGYCNGCGLIKPLAMVAVAGLHENEKTGELEGGELALDPLQRSGFCEPCAIKWLASQNQ